MKNAPVSVESSAATVAGGAPLRFRRPRFARATLFAAAASVVVAATGGMPGFAPLASGAVESDFSKTESISISFGGQELTIGSPGAVPVAHENWNVPGALANGTIENLKGGSGSLTGVGVRWQSGGDVWHSGANVTTANGQLTWGYLDDPEFTNFWGMSDIGPSIMLSNLGSLPASTFDVYVILASDSSNPAEARPVYVNGTWYTGGPNSTVPGEANWTRKVHENGDVMTEGTGGSYLKVSVPPDGEGTIKIVSGKRHPRASLAAVQVVYDITSSFLTWNAGNATWDASSNSFQDSSGNATSWGISTGGQVAVFNGNDAPTLSGTHSASGLWVKSGDVVLNGDGAVNLVYAAKVVVENGASLTVGSSVNLNFTNSSGSLVLEGANSHFYANKPIALPSVGGSGTYHANAGMTVLTGESSTANFYFTNGGALAINPAKVATPFTLSGTLTGTGQVVAQGGILRVTSPSIGALNSISFSVQSGASIGFGPGAQINSLTLADGSIYSLLGDSLPYSPAQISTLDFGGTGAVKISFSELPLTAFTPGTPFTVFGYSGSALTPEVLSALTTDTARVAGTFAYSAGSLTFTPFTVGFYQREWTAAGDGNWTGANYEYANWNSTLITDPNANGDRIYLPATSTRRTITIDAGKIIHLDSTKTGWTWGVGTGLADSYAGGLTRLGNGQWVIEGGTLDTGTAVQGAYAILAAGSNEGNNWSGIRTDAGLVIRSKITGSGSIATVHNGYETIKLYIAGDASEYTGTIHLAQNNRDMALIDNGVLGDGATVTGAGSLKIFTSTTLGATVNANVQIGSYEGHSTVPTNSIVRLTGENNISSSIYVYSGTLAVTKDANLGSNSLTIGANTSGLNAGATPTLQFLADGATFSKAFAVEHSNSSIKVGTASTNDSGAPISVTYNGQISGGGGLTKTGAGKLTLTGSGYSYTGGTNVNAGTLSIGADANIGSGTHTINNNATLEISGNITKPWVIGASGGTISTTGAAGDVRTFAMLSGSGKLTKAGASTLALTGTPDFTGPVNISAGVLKLGNGGTTGILAGTSPITLSGGGSLVLDLADQPGVTQTFSRAIDGSGTFSKNNTAAVAFTGTTTSNVTLAVNSGTLLTSGAIGGSVDVVNRAVFGATGGTIANLTLQDGSIYRAVDGFAVPVTNLVAPSGTVYFDIGGIFSPGMALGPHPLLGFSNLSGSANFEILDANAYRGSFSILKNANDITLNVNSVGGSYSLRWTGEVDSNWAFSTQNWRIISGGTVDAPSDFVANDSVLFDSTAPANRRTVTLAAGAQFKPAAMTVDTANGANYIFDGAGSIAGDELAVVLKGGGTVTINTDNRYGVLSGGTRIETGTTVNIGHVNALGSGVVTVLDNTTINANAGPFANAIQLANGSFTLNFPGRETSELVIGNALSGVGNLTVSGSARRTFTNPTGFTGTLHLSAPVTFSGANADWSGVALVTSSVSGDHNFTGTGTTRLKSIEFSGGSILLNAAGSLSVSRITRDYDPSNTSSRIAPSTETGAACLASPTGVLAVDVAAGQRVDLQAKIAAGTTLEKYGQGTLRFDFTGNNRENRRQDLLTTIRIVEGIWELSRDGGYQPSTPFINNAVGSSIVLEDGAKWHIYGDCFWKGDDGGSLKLFTTTIKEGAELVWKTGQGNQVSLGPTTLLGSRLVNDVGGGNQFMIGDITVNALPGATSSAPTESILGGTGAGFHIGYNTATATFTVTENALLSVTTYLLNSYNNRGACSIVKAGAGKMVLSDSRGSFTGAITINGGVLETPFLTGTGNSTLGSVGTKRNLTLNNGGILRYTGSSVTDSGEKKLNFNLLGDGTGILDIVEDRGTDKVDLEQFSAGFTKLGAGLLYLGGSNANAGLLTIGTGTQAGGTVLSGKTGTVGGIGAAGARINQGILRLNADNQVNDAATITLNGAGGDNAKAVLDLNGKTDTMSALAGPAGTVTSAGGVLTLSTASDNVYDGVITGSLALIKNGTGRQAFTGANNYTGATTVNGGTLAMLGAFQSAITVNNAGTLETGSSTSGSTGGTVTINNGGTLLLGGGTLGPLTFTGTSTLRPILDGNDNFTPGAVDALSGSGATVNVDLIRILGKLTSGEFRLFTYSSSSALPTFQPSGMTGLRGSVTVGQGTGANASSIVVKMASALYDLVWTGSSSQVWNNLGAANWATTPPSAVNTFATYDTVTFPAAFSGSKAITISGDVNPAKVTVEGDGWSFSGDKITGSETKLYKTGAGTLTLNAAAGYAGGTYLQGGQITLNNASALGTGPVTLWDGTTLAYSTEFPNRILLEPNANVTLSPPATDQSIANLIEGVGSVNVTGTARRTFTSATGFTGTLRLSAPVTFSGANADWSGVALVTSSVSGDHNFTGTGTTRLKSIEFSGGSILLNAAGSLSVSRITRDSGSSDSSRIAPNAETAAACLASLTGVLAIDVAAGQRVDLQAKIAAGTTLEKYGQGTLRFDFTNSNSIDRTKKSQDLLTTIRIVEGIWELSRDGGYQPSTPFINNAVGSSIVLEDGAKWHIYGDCFWAGHDGNFSKVFTTTIKEGAELVWKTGQGNQVSLGPTTLLGGRLVNDVNTGDSSVANRFVIEDITVNALPGATSSAPTESILGGVGFGFNMSYGDAPTVTFTVAENALLSVTTSLRNSYKPGTSGVSSIVKAGAGKMVLSDARSSFTGATTINGGTLSIAVDNSMASAPGYTVNGSGSALELLDNAVLHATAPISLNAGGTLRFDRTSAISLPNAVTGAGNIRKSGAGSTATLTNAAGFTGAFQVDANGGTLAVTTAWPANSASVEIGAGGVLTFLDGSTRKNIVLNNANASFAGRKGTPAADISGNLALTGGHVLHIADPSLATSGALSTGTLTIDGSLSLGVATLVFDVNSATDHDKLVLSNGILSFNSGAKPALSFNFLDDRAPDADFDILSLSGSAANTLAGILTSDPTAKLDFLISGAPVDPDVHQLLFSYKDNGNTLSMSVEDAPTIFYWAGATGNWDKSATTLAWSKDGTSAPAAYRDRLITRFSVAKQGTGAIPATLATDIQISDVIVPRAYKVTNPQVGITIEDGTFTFTNTTGRISGETWLDLGAGAKLTLAVANAGSSANDFTGAINLAAGARLVADNAGADSVPVISNTNVPSLLGTGKTDNSTYFTGFTLDTGATLSLNNASTTLLNTSDRPFRFAGDSATLESTSATGKGVYLTGAFSYSAAKAAAATAFTLNLGGAGVGSISSVLADNGSGALSIVKTGAGKWTLSNNGNLFSGGVAISGGTLEVGRLFTETAGDPAPLGKGNVGRTLTLNTGGQLRYTGRASNNAAGGKLWFNIAGDGTGTIDIAEADARVEAGTIQSGFTKDGAGTLLLPNGSHAVGSGQDVTVKQGALLLAGTLDVKDNTIEVKSAGGLYLQDDARINNTALLNLSEAGAKFDLRGKSETIQKLDGAAGTLITNTGARDLSATVAGNPGGADAASTLRISGDHSGTFAGVIADDSAADASRVLNLEVVGDIWTYSSPEQTLSGINTYTGSTTIGTLATLKLSGTGSIAQSSGVIFSGSSGTFDITAVDTSTTIKGISSSSTATINLGSKTLVIKPESAASTLVYSGLISALAGGNFVYEGMTATSGSVFATGASSRLQLKAANNSYKGSAGIKGGILELASASGTPRAYAVFNRNDTVTVTVEGPTSAQPSAPTGYLLLSATGSNVFANKLSGTGAVVATGSTQALGLTADNTAFTGTFMARDGATLLANATATAANFGVVSGAGATIQLGGVIAADGAGKFKYEGGAASQLQLAGLALGAASNEIEVVNAGATLGFAGTFSTVGSGPQLVKKGAGALVFSGTASAASVPIRVDAGQLGIVNTSSAGTGDITFNAGSTTLSLGSAATTGAALTFQNNLSSADLGGGAFARGTLLVDSPVTATVTGSNSGFHGDVVVRGGGTVAVSSLSALGALDNTLTLGGNGGAGDMGSGTLRLSGTFALGSRDINLGSQGAFIDAATAVTNAFHSGRLSGAGFEKLGPGSFSLSAAASVNAGWAGAIKISGGILTLVNTGSAGTGGITLNGVSASSATLRLGFIDTQSAGLDSTTGAAMDFTQALASASGGSGTLLVDSPVTVTMSGAANASTFEGRVVVRGDGLLSVSSADALGAASNTLFLGGAVSGDETGSGTLRATASLDLASRNVILGSANSGYVETVGDTTRVVHSGTLSGGTLRKLGTGILALHGDNSAFAGAVEVRAGVLEIAGSTAIAGAHGVDSLGAGKLTLGFGTGASAVSATLRVAANSGSLAYAVAGDANLPANTVALSGLGGVFDIGADSSLALSKHVSSPGFTAGLDSGNIPHASVLTKSGQGELVLSSDNSAVFSGNATVQGGVLTLAHESALGLNNESSAPAVTVAAGGVLRISAAPQNWRGALLGAGEVHVADAVVTVLGFEGNTLSGAWRATAGASITATAPAAFGSASFILGGDAGSAAASPLDGFSGAGALVLNFAADANAASDWNTATTASPQGSGALPTYVIGAGRALSLRAAGGSVEIPAGVAVEFQGLVHSAATAGADAATEGALTKLGAGVLVLANAGNAVTAKGALNISAGMVEAVDTAAIPGGPLTLGSASALGTLRVDASGALASTAIVISGKGGVLDVSGDTTSLSTGRVLAASALDAGAGLAKEGRGALVLSADQSAFSGAFDVREGLLNFASSTPLAIGGGLSVDGASAPPPASGAPLLTPTASVHVNSELSIGKPATATAASSDLYLGQYSALVFDNPSGNTLELAAGTGTGAARGASAAIHGVLAGVGEVRVGAYGRLVIGASALGAEALQNGSSTNPGLSRRPAVTPSGNVTIGADAELAIGRELGLQTAGILSFEGSSGVTPGDDHRSVLNLTAYQNEATYVIARALGGISIAGSLPGNGNLSQLRVTAGGRSIPADNVDVGAPLGFIVADVRIVNFGDSDFTGSSVAGANSATQEIQVNAALAWYNANTANAHGIFNVAENNSFVLGHRPDYDEAARPGGLLQDRVESAVFTGDIGGVGSSWNGRSLTKSGKGELVLYRANDYTGKTEVLDGVLTLQSVDAAGVYAGTDAAVDVKTSSSVLRFDLRQHENPADTGTYDRPVDGTYARVIGGYGDVEKLNSGTLVLSSRQAYSGATRVLGGTLAITAGPDALASSGRVEIASGASLDYSGATGSGPVVLKNLDGAPGSSLVLPAGGLLDVGQTGGVNTGSGTFGGALDVSHLTSGVIPVIAKRGGGTFSLAGDYSALSASLVVHEGVLSVEDAALNLSGARLTLNAPATRFEATTPGSTPLRLLSLDGVLGSVLRFEAHSLWVASGGTFGGTLYGAGELRVLGGRLTLAGDNSALFSGRATIREGTLALDGAGSLSNAAAIEIAPQGALTASFDISGATPTGGAPVVVRSLTSSSASLPDEISPQSQSIVVLGANTLRVSGAGVQGGVRFRGVIKGQGGLEKAGPHELLLSNTQGYAGLTKVEDGVLTLAGAGSIGASAGLALTGQDARFDASQVTGSAALRSLSGVAGSSIAAGTARLLVGGLDETLAGESAPGSYGDGSGLFAGTISGLNGLVKGGSGVLELTAAQAALRGGVLVGAGTLRLAGESGLPNASGLSIAPGAILDIATHLDAPGGAPEVTLKNLSGGAGAVRLGSNTLRVDGGASSSFDGEFSGDVDSLLLVGSPASNVLRLTGASTGFLGEVRVAPGAALALSGSFASAKGLSLGELATAGLSGTGSGVWRNLDMAADSRVDAGANPVSLGTSGGQDGAGTIAGVIAGTSTLGKHGSGLLTVLVPQEITGLVTLHEGSLKIAGTGSLSSAAGLHLGAHTILNLGDVSSGRAVLRNLTSDAQAPGAVAHLGGIELTVGVKDLPGTGGGTLGAVLDGASGSVVKTGPGTLTLTAVNDYAGATRVEQGTLALAGQGGIASSSRLTLEAGAGFDASALASGTTVLKSITAGAGSDVSLGGGTLTLQIGASGTDTGDSLFAGILRGAASTRLLKDGPGELVVVSGNSATFSGRVSVVDGSLLLRDLGGVGGGAITVDGSLGLLAGGTFANVIDGYGDVRAAGAAQAPVRVTLGTANTGFGGSFSVGANATLFAPAPGSLGMPTVALNLSSGGALELGGTAFDLDTRPVTLGPGGGSMLLAPGLSATLSGVLSGAADAPLSIVAAGAGVAPSLTLLSVAPLQGAVNVEGARLLLSQGGSLAASAGLGLSGAVLDISGLDATATGLARLDGDAGSVVELGDGRTLAIGQGVFSGVFSGTDSTLVKTQAASSGNLLALTNPDALRGFSGTLRVTAGGGTLALAVTRLPVALDIGADATLRLEPAAGSVLDFSGATGAAGAAFAANATLDIRSGSFALPDAARLLSAGAVLAIGPGATGLAGSPADMAGKRLSFQGGSLLFGSTLLAPETPLQNLAQLDATGGGRVLLPLGSSLPAASLPDPALNVFDLAAAPEMRQVLLIQADGVTLPGQLELRDENGAVFSQPVRRELVDAGGETLGAFYFAHAVSLDGSNASPASRGLYLGYGLDRVEAGSGKVVRLDSTGARNAAPAVLARLSGLGGFEITGAAGQSVLVGNGLNDYAGPTRIAAPAGGSYTVRLVADSALGRTRSITLDGAAVLDMGGRAQATGTLSGPAESAIVLGSLTLEDGTYAGRISGGLAADAVSLRKTGPGVLHLGGAADYSGVTHVSGGTLRFGGTLGAGAAGAPNVHTGEFRLDAGATLGFATAAGERLDGVISGGGSLLQDGPGVLHVASPLNTYSGGTRVTGGVLLARSITALGTGVTTIDSAVPALSDGSPVAAAATLAFDLSGALWERPVEFAGNGGVLRLDSDAAFGSPGMGGFTGAGALVKTGAGTLTLGARNTLRGAVDVFDGRLALATADSLALASGLSLHAGSSATAAQPQTFQSLVLDAGATYDSAGMALTLHAGSAAGVDLLNVATLTKAGEGVLSIASSFAAPLVVNGALDVQSGTLRLAFDPDGAVVKAGSVSFSADATIDVGGYDLGAILGADASILIATNSAIPAASLPKKYLFDGHEPAATDYATLQFTNAPAGFGSGLYISASLRWNDIHIDDAGKFDLADGVFDITGEHLFTYSLADRQDFAGKSAVGWDGRTLTKRGVGTLILAVPQYYTGDTRVEAGVLRVGDAAHPSAALGARDLEIGGDYVGTIRVASGASVVFNQSVPQVLRGGLAELSVTEGAAPLVEKSGPGTLTFLGTVAFSRGTIRNTEPLSVLRFEGAADIGTLELRGDAVFASETASAGRVSLNGSARLEVAPGSSLAVTGEFTLAGTPSIALAPGATLRVSAPFETSSQVGLEVGPRALFVLGAAARIGSDISGGGLIEACGATFEAQNVTASLTVSASTAATLSGTLTGALSNSGSADIGAVTGDIENSGRLRLRQWSNGSIRNNAGAVLESAASHGGDVHNSEGALLSLDAGRSRTDIAGALYNSGTVRFGNLGHTLGVRVLHNEVAGVAGFFDLETDYGAAANLDRVVLDPSTPVADHDGSHVLYVRAGYNKSAATSGTRIPLVATDGAPLSEVSYPNATFVLDPRSDTDAGLYHYVLQDAHTPVLRADGYSGTVTAAANFAAAVSPAWFAQTDNLLLQLVELRSDLATSARDAGEKASTAPGGGAGDAKSAAFSALPATSSAFWLRAYARQLDTDLGVANLPDYRANQYGADVGYDAAFLVDNARLHIGGFAGYQTTRIHLRDNRGGKGDADSAAFGLYAAYVRPDGWFATAIAQGQTFDVDYTATTAATPQGRENAHRGQYEDLAAGLAFELGKRISLPLPHSLHLEPTFNLAWTHVIADSYSTTTKAIDDAPLQISPDDADVFRAGAALRLGTAFALGGVSTLHPYVRASLAYETSSGGGITATARGRDESARLDPNVDGLRGSIGLGAALRLTSSQSLQLDYEATYGAKYTIPYSITVSYRHRF